MIIYCRNFVKKVFPKPFHPVRCISWKLSSDNIVTADGNLTYPKDETLFQFATKKFLKFGEKPALVDGITGRTYTFSDVVEKSKQFGKFLNSKNYGVNDVIGIHAHNSIEYPLSFFGSTYAGSTFTTANPIYNHDELVFQLKSSNTKVLLTTSSQCDLARQVAETCAIDLLISMDEPKVHDSGLLYFHDCLNIGKDLPETNIDIDPQNRVVLLPYSSGTTGLPKGVTIADQHLIANIIQFNDGLDENKETYDKILAVLPMYHIYCLHVLCMIYFTRGCTLHVLPSFDPQTYLDAIQRFKVQSAAIVPPILLFMLNHPMVDKYDLSSLSHILVGAAPTKEDVANQFKRRFPHAETLQGYGMTECLITHKQYSEGIVNFKPRPDSCGNVFRGIEMKIQCQDTGKSLGPNEIGELCIRGPQVSFGYFDNPEATGSSFLDDGWVLTGDLAYFNEKFETFIVDRIKELIKYKGLQVAPAELEGIILSHDDVVECCVIGIPDERAGEVPRAFVVKRENSSVTSNEIVDYLKERVSPFKQLRGGVEFVESLPKLASGKLLRRKVKDNYLQALTN